MSGATTDARAPMHAVSPDGDRLDVFPDDPSGAFLAAPRFAVLAKFRDHDSWVPCGTHVRKTAAERQADLLVESYGWAATAVAAIQRRLPGAR